MAVASTLFPGVNKDGVRVGCAELDGGKPLAPLRFCPIVQELELSVQTIFIWLVVAWVAYF